MSDTASPKIKLVDYWAPWCGPCKMMDPILNEIEKEMAGTLEVVKINVDEQVEVSAKDNIMSIPTYVVIKNGQEVGRKIGFTPKADLIKLING